MHVACMYIYVLFPVGMPKLGCNSAVETSLGCGN